MATVKRTAAAEPTRSDRGPKAATRRIWGLGDYHRFATQLVWDVGPVLVEACRVRPGQRVLDVAAGTGNVAIRAAAAGARVVASDLTPENFAAGRREALAHGVELDWIEADAEALPFDDHEFDVVTSSFGAMFAPDHRAVARELARVCRPGGTIGMANFTAEGLAGRFFDIVGSYAPPAQGPSPLLWGNERYVRGLLGARVASLTLTRRQYVERSPGGPEEYIALFTETFGPLVAIRDALAGQPDRRAELDRELARFATEADRGSGDRSEYHYEYLLVVAQTPPRK